MHSPANRAASVNRLSLKYAPASQRKKLTPGAPWQK